MKVYEYKHPYEWHWTRRIRRFEFPKDFIRKFDDPTPYVRLEVETTRGKVVELVPITKMKLAGDTNA